MWGVETALAYDDLRDWIKALDKAGELKRIHEPGGSHSRDRRDHRQSVQMGQARYESAPGGPALLFENVKGYPGSRVLMNQFGSERRMKLALSVDTPG